MGRNVLLTFLCSIAHVFIIKAQGVTTLTTANDAEAQEKKIALLTQQATFLREKLKQTTIEKQQLAGQVFAHQRTIQARNDSIANLWKSIQTLNETVDRQHKEASMLQDTIAHRVSDLQKANTQIRSLEYDKKNLIDNSIVRVYNFSAADVRKQFLQSLAAPGSGFQYDDALIDDEIQITRNFNDQAEAWWVFDKTLDTILELKVRIKPHLYDPQKSIVFGETKLLQKTRFSNKPFEEQHDQDKIKLYREKAFHMLEGKLKGTSDK